MPSEFESFVGCRIDFGEDADEIVFDRQARQLHVVGADPYLNAMLVRYCEEALSHRRANTSSLRTAIENVDHSVAPSREGADRHCCPGAWYEQADPGTEAGG